jgi:hypothetical protein
VDSDSDWTYMAVVGFIASRTPPVRVQLGAQFELGTDALCLVFHSACYTRVQT